MNKAKSLFNAIHPGALTLFLIQIFSTLSYSVIYATLVLYITNALHLSDHFATSVIATFVAFNYGLHLLGGYLGGRFLSYRGLFCVGMILQVAGCFILSFPSTNAMYWAMAAFLAGSGLNVTCINCLLTQLFSPADKRRESAFFWNYSGRNLGYLIGFGLAGLFQIGENYHTLFLLSGFGNIIALLTAIFFWTRLGDVQTIFSESSNKVWRVLFGLAILAALVIVLRRLFTFADISSNIILWIAGFMAVVLIYLTITRRTKAERNNMWAYYIFAWAALFFWALFEMMPMGLTLFIERNVDRHILGLTIPPQWFLNVDSIVVIIGGPLLASIFKRLRGRGFKVEAPILFAVAMTLIGLAVAIIPLGIFFANHAGYTSAKWMVMSYILLAAGELFLNPVGYAMIGELAPPRFRGILMGTWIMVIGAGASLSNVFSKLALGPTDSQNPLLTNAAFSHTFLILGSTSIAIGIILFLMRPFLTYLMKK